MQIKEFIPNAKPRLSVLFTIATTILPPILSLTLYESGAFHIHDFGYAFFGVIGILFFVILVKLVLNNPIEIGESIAMVLIFSFALTFSVYIYIKSFLNGEDSTKDLIVNLSNFGVSLCTSIPQLAAVFYRSWKRHVKRKDRLSRDDVSALEQGIGMNSLSAQSETTLNAPS